MNIFLLFWGVVLILVGIIVTSKSHSDQNLLKLFGVVLMAVGAYLLLVSLYPILAFLPQ